MVDWLRGCVMCVRVLVYCSSVCLLARLFVCLPGRLIGCMFVCLFAWLFVCVCLRVFVSSFVCLFVCLFVRL